MPTLGTCFRSLVSLSLAFLLATSPAAVYAQGLFVSTLPEPGVMVSPSLAMHPPLLKGLTVYPDKPFNFDFIVDSGSAGVGADVVAAESQRMVKYFLTAVTVPEAVLWVNLSPFEKDRIIDDSLGHTDLGRDMLAQDYVLKQLTASLVYPEKGLGKEFWDRIYQESAARFGAVDIPVDAFNKVWIMPAKAEVFEKGNAVYVTEARLKVMLDSDRIAGAVALGGQGVSSAGDLTRRIMREVLVPAIEKEINTGRNFAVIRQIYHAAILAKWYRGLVQDTLLEQFYVGQNRVGGLLSAETKLKEEIYQRYIAAYKKGVFNYIQDAPDRGTGDVVPRKYFSGGELFSDIILEPAQSIDKVVGSVGGSFIVSMVGVPQKMDSAQLTESDRQAEKQRQQAFNKEIAQQVSLLNASGVKPRVQNRDLMAFVREADSLVNFIMENTVLKKPEDVHRILGWRLQVEQNSDKRPVLSGMTAAEARALYNAIFDQQASLEMLASKEKPVNVLFFRREARLPLANILKTIANVNLKVFVSGSGDGRSWFYGARAFSAAGIPAAGQSLVDLANDPVVADFCDYRIRGNGSQDKDLEKNLRALVEKLKKPQAAGELNGEMLALHQTTWKMNVEKRLSIAESLSSFLDYWSERKVDSAYARQFSLFDIPIRSLLLVGLWRQHQENWQQAINELGVLLDVKPGNEVIFPLKKHGLLVALAADGTLLLSETAIIYYASRQELLGVWMVNAENWELLQNDQRFTDGRVDNEKFFAGLEILDQSIQDGLAKTVREPVVVDIPEIVQDLDRMSIKDSVEESADKVIKEADIIFYSGNNQEVDVAGALAVPGVRARIESNAGAVKINGYELASMDGIQAIGKRTARSLQPAGQIFNKEVMPEDYLDYLLIGQLAKIDAGSMNSAMQKLEAEAKHGVRAVGVNSSFDQQVGFLSSIALSESIFSLLAIKRAGFAVSATSGLIRKGDKSGQESEIGLFKEKRSVRELINFIQQNWQKIVKNGAFVFDVDKTILPKGAAGLAAYRELAFLIMRLLREGVQAGIISGNSKEEQMRRIYDAIHAEMRDDPSAFEKLTLYVDGGATMVGFDTEGKPLMGDQYNIEHAVSRKALEEAMGAVLTASNLKEWIGKDNDSIEAFKAAVNAYLDKNYSGLSCNFAFLEDEAWKPEFLTPDQVRERQKKGGSVSGPFVEMRGDAKVIGEGLLASVTVKPLLPFKVGDKETDPRTFLRLALAAKLSEGGAKDSPAFHMRAAGSSSFDITQQNAGKAAALIHFILSKGLDKNLVFYFGDEFFSKIDKNGVVVEGNDMEVALVAELLGIHFLAVNESSRDISEGILHMGRTPQAVVEFLRDVFMGPMFRYQWHDAAQVTGKSAMQGGIDIQDIALVRDGARWSMGGFNEEFVRGAVEGGFAGFVPLVISVTPVAGPLAIFAEFGR